MYILGFFFILTLPFMPLFQYIGPSIELVPDYFANKESRFLSMELSCITFFWVGFLRNLIGIYPFITEKFYGRFLMVLFVLLLGSKIILAVPFMWSVGLISFFVGWLCITDGQKSPGLALIVLIIISSVIWSTCFFFLTSFSYFDQNPAFYHYYMILFKDIIGLNSIG